MIIKNQSILSEKLTLINKRILNLKIYQNIIDFTISESGLFI